MMLKLRYTVFGQGLNKAAVGYSKGRVWSQLKKGLKELLVWKTKQKGQKYEVFPKILIFLKR